MMSRFPKITETFVLFEMQAMEREGVRIEVYPLLRARNTGTHPEGAGIWGKFVELLRAPARDGIDGVAARFELLAVPMRHRRVARAAVQPQRLAAISPTSTRRLSVKVAVRQPRSWPPTGSWATSPVLSIATASRSPAT